MFNKIFKDIAVNALLILGGVLIGLILLECIIRPHHAPFENFILQDGGDLVGHFFKKLYRHDPDLGWVPMSNASVTKWGGRVSTLDDGIRSNGRYTYIDNDITMLTLGDSFTFGDDVTDENTWPAFLQLLTHSKVYNAGVSSYGMDQTVLRAEGMIKKYNPHVVILSIVYDDTQRCRQTIRHGIPKPYFTIENNALVYHKQSQFYGVSFDWFRRIFGYSYVCHRILGGLFPDYWFSGTSRDIHSIPGHDLLIAALLFDKFMKLAQSRDVVFLVQGGNDSNKDQEYYLESLVDYVKQHYPQVHVVFIPPLLIQLNNTNHQLFEDLFVKDSPTHHMSPTGNMLIAQLVTNELRKFTDLKSLPMQGNFFK